MYSVKEVAKLLDLTEHTVRYYTDKGLVPNIKRDKNNNRLFDDKSINWRKISETMWYVIGSHQNLRRFVFGRRFYYSRTL